MAFLQSSGAISINDIKTLFGGPASPALSNYYRGGSYIPSSKTVTVTDPNTTGYYSNTGSGYFWMNQTGYNGLDTRFRWAGANYALGAVSLTSYTTGGYTYYRAAFATRITTDYGYGYIAYNDYYYIYRTYQSTTSINGNVPTSGAISLSNFYGAEKP